MCVKASNGINSVLLVTSYELATEVVERDVFGFDSKVFTHLSHALIHDWRTTEVELDVFWSRVVVQVVVNHDLVNEPLRSHPSCLQALALTKQR